MVRVKERLDWTSDAQMARTEPKRLGGLANWRTRWTERKTGFLQPTADTGMTGWMKTSSGPVATDMKCF